MLHPGWVISNWIWTWDFWILNCEPQLLERKDLAPSGKAVAGSSTTVCGPAVNRGRQSTMLHGYGLHASTGWGNSSGLPRVSGLHKHSLNRLCRNWPLAAYQLYWAPTSHYSACTRNSWRRSTSFITLKKKSDPKKRNRFPLVHLQTGRKSQGTSLTALLHYRLVGKKGRRVLSSAHVFNSHSCEKYSKFHLSPFTSVTLGSSGANHGAYRTECNRNHHQMLGYHNATARWMLYKKTDNPAWIYTAVQGT